MEERGFMSHWEIKHYQKMMKKSILLAKLDAAFYNTLHIWNEVFTTIGYNLGKLYGNTKEFSL